MSLKLTFVGGSRVGAEKWVEELRSALGALGAERDLSVDAHVPSDETRPDPLGNILFFDGTTEEALLGLDHLLAAVDRRGRAVFLIASEDGRVPQAVVDGRVDDVLVHPFRGLEILARLIHFERILMWQEVSSLNATFSELLTQLRDDLKLAERLQKTKLPVRFPEVRGIKFASRYMAGMRSGGDYFDIADSRDGSQLSLLMSDSSSYGLSSAVLSVLMRVAMKLSSGEVRSCNETVRRIYGELAATLNEKDRLSLFYGVLSRKDFRLRYVNLGTSCAFLSQGEGFRVLPTQADVVTRFSGPSALEEATVVLGPGDRLVLVSDGFVEAAGGAEKAALLLDRTREGDASDSLNELVYAVKSKLAEPDDLPAQDCSALILDLDRKLVRLT